MKKALILAVIAAAAVFAGCGDNSSQADKVTESQVLSSSEAKGEKTVKDIDVFEGLWKSGGEKWLGLTREQVSQRSGGIYDKANAKESTDDCDGFDLGEQTAILGGKADIGVKMPVMLWIYYKDGKASKLVYSIDPEGKVENADEKPVLDKLEKFLADNAPDGYSRKDGTPASGKGSFYFFNGDRESCIFEVSVSSGVGSTNFPVRLSVQTYRDKYGQ